MKYRLLTTIILLVLATTASSVAQDRQDPKSIAAIRAVLETQAAAWNRGDVEGYMNGYERSPNTVFVSGDRVTRGWQPVLERYKKAYDTRDKMGVQYARAFTERRASTQDTRKNIPAKYKKTMFCTADEVELSDVAIDE